jgi:hypothetical protein
MRRDHRATGPADPDPTQRLFTAWLKAAESRLAIVPVVSGVAGGRLSFGFLGITDAIGGEMTWDDEGEVRLSAVAVPFGPVWDLLFHTAAPRRPGLDPLFWSFAAWINDELARADRIAIWTRQAGAAVFDRDGATQPTSSAATARRAKLLPPGVNADAAAGADWPAWKLLACLPVRLPGHGG